MEKLGCYIHIPFCKKKCYYCDFCAYQGVEDYIEDYFNHLKREITLYQDKFSVELDTIYIGGGTPSYVDTGYLEEVVDLLRNFKFSDDLEFTLEANPGSLSKEKLGVYRDLGVNRISLGVQSFDDEILQAIGRDHTSAEVLEDLDLIREVGISNISLDLILNLPGQDEGKILHDLEMVKKISPSHLSRYSLILERGSHFYSLEKEGKLDLFDEDLERDIFARLVEELEKIGLRRYEISNFAKEGYQSRHNKKYREGENYLAFGMAASGFIGDYRYTNYNNFYKYFKALDENKLPIEEGAFESLEEEERDYIIFKLRECEGINLKTFEKKFGHSFMETYGEVFKRFYDLGYFNLGENISFTPKGMDLSNQFYIEII